MSEFENRPGPNASSLSTFELTLKKGCEIIMAIAALALIKQLSDIVQEIPEKGASGVAGESVVKAIIFAGVATAEFSAQERMK